MVISASNNAATAPTSSLEVVVSKAARPLSVHQSILTQLYFGAIDGADQNFLSIHTDLEVLGPDLFAQYWVTDEKVKQSRYKNVRYAYNRQMLFGYVRFACSGTYNFQQLSERAYRQIYECLINSGCRRLLRTWNYFPQITKTCSDYKHHNRYELFCNGRLCATRASGIDNKVYPAATVIGNRGDYLQVYFLASDAPGVAVENPRQTSAYHYPVANSFTQPLFARGVLKAWGERTHLYVSGTASIVGHETLHINNVGAQLNEAINNVETLVEHANDQHQAQLNAQDDLLYMKVYVRHNEDLARVQQVLTARLASDLPRMLLLGDMCRDDLLVEIEAFYQT